MNAYIMCLGTLPTGRKLLQATLQLTSKVGDFLAIMGNCVCVCLVALSSVNLCDPMPTRLLCPWDFSGKTTGVGCHFLLQWEILINQNSTFQTCIHFEVPNENLCTPHYTDKFSHFCLYIYIIVIWK